MNLTRVVQLLGTVATLKPLAGYRTYLGAAGLVGLAVYQFSQGQYDSAAASVSGALVAFGLRAATDSPAAAALVALALAAPPAVAADPPSYRLPPGEMVPHVVTVAAAAGESADWGVTAIGAPAAWKVTKGKGAVVAVLDTGCDSHHKDLAGKIRAARDFTGSRSGASDVHGHGTHCAGVVAAAENGWGLVGVAPQADLIIGKVLGDDGTGRSDGIAAAIDWAAGAGAGVISMSLGGPTPDPLTRAAIQRATAKGVIVVCAAGNEGPEDGTVGYPGGYPEAVAVAAVDAEREVADFSSRGPNVFVAAPGVNVRSCFPGNRFATMSGTSMATPHVAGVAALWWAAETAAGRTPTADGFRSALRAAAVDLPPAGRDHDTGFGFVQPAKMLKGK